MHNALGAFLIRSIPVAEIVCRVVRALAMENLKQSASGTNCHQASEMGIDCLGYQESHWENVDPLKKCLVNIKNRMAIFQKGRVYA